jgi:hypothetical protein
MVTTGVLGGRWRASVTEWGGIVPWRDEPALQWHVAADDRWHSPEREPAVRQTTVGGTPVTETRVRIPDGDAVQRVHSVPDHGGLTLIEVENTSPLPIAVAFTHGRLLSARRPSAQIEGIELPEGSVVFPVGHHASVTVALAHDGRGQGQLPTGLPTAAGVARGWTAITERAGRLLLPDAAAAERVVRERCELALGGPTPPDDDAVAFLLGVGQLVRMGEKAEPWAPDVAAAAEQVVRRSAHDPAAVGALRAAATVFRAAGDQRAVRDLEAMQRKSGVSEPALPAAAPDDPARWLWWTESRLVQPTTAGAALLPAGIPPTWLGDHFEVYGLPTGTGGTASFAVRWHGARPAVLWEQTEPSGTLTAPVVAPDWRTSEARGEALWPEPAGAAADRTVVLEGDSFS